MGRWAYWVAGAAVVPAALTAYGVTVPGGKYAQISTALWLWALLAVAWFVTGRERMRFTVDRRDKLVLLVVPVLFAATYALTSLDIIGRATFAHYRPALEATPLSEHPVSLGPYAFGRIDEFNHCRMYHQEDSAMFRVTALAWCPDGGPGHDTFGEGEVYERIDGDWYVMLVRHGLYKDRKHGADPWGLQLTELQSPREPDV